MTPLLTRIRAKVVASVPDIATKNDSARGGYVCRPIRLTDVLLAIDDMNDDGGEAWAVGSDGLFRRPRLGGLELGEEWNLREDDLEKQSPETLEFIGEILGV